MSSNNGPGYRNHPEHKIELRPAGVRVRVHAGGEIIADSADVIGMREGSYAPVWYLPRSDVKMERLERTSHSTHCPFKGDASYFSIKGVERGENAVWSYERPFDEVLAIKGRLAFYPDRVEIETIG